MKLTILNCITKQLQLIYLCNLGRKEYELFEDVQNIVETRSERDNL